MRGPSILRRMVALAAAYVAALQLVLLPLGVAAASPRFAPLCSELAATTTPATPRTDSSGGVCVCASGCGTQCCASALAGAPPDFVSVARAEFVVVAPKPFLTAALFAVQRAPQNPRAPPQLPL